MKISDLQAMIERASRQLHQLQIQQSSMGIYTPPHVTTSIQDLSEFVQAARLVVEISDSSEFDENDLPSLRSTASRAGITL